MSGVVTEWVDVSEKSDKSLGLEIFYGSISAKYHQS